jgi:hypothetical protein
VAIMGIVPRIPAAQADDFLLDGSAEYTLRRHLFDHLGEQGDYMKMHLINQ